MADRKQTEASAQIGSRVKNILENLFVVVLAFYPLRHIGWGLDLWDTGYNYANFQYMGTDHMDPMWLFSTYMANGVGHFISGLPNAGNLWGMNLYTGLLVSLLALVGYFFCTRVLNMPAWVAFLGEFAAVSLCWCPTALLYNYLTYVLVLACLILLYQGLLKERKWCLFGAGVCLGINVLVRFSNLPEMALILAVWAYDVILWRDAKLAGMEDRIERFWPRLGRHTLWCLLGYLAALAAMFLDIQIRYGISSYVEGIQRLFAMTENAADYKPTAMIMGLVGHYVNNIYWVLRFAVILVGGMALFALVGWLQDRLGGKSDQKSGPVRALSIGVRVFWCLVSIAILFWLYYRERFSFLYYSYDSIWYPSVWFLMLTMFIALIRIFHPDSPREERLISGMVLLVVLITPIGSNNGFFPSLNNLFLAAPYTLWQSWRFIRNAGEKRVRKLRLFAFPAKGVLTAFLALCLFQFGMFGAVFVFAEGTGVQNADSYVENNEILQGIRMSEERARWLTEISGYVNENDLRDREVILYGRLPALSYYLQMPSAFNPWSDLASYSLTQMEMDLEETAQNMAQDPEYRPVIIVEREYMAYLTDGVSALEELGLSQSRIDMINQDQKWVRLVEFMEIQGYVPGFDNGKFTVFR